jgi:hypothetical protein
MSEPGERVMDVLLPVAWHLGPLHGYEKLLVLLVAFGPFVVLSLVVRYARRRDLEEEAREDATGTDDLSDRPPAT